MLKQQDIVMALYLRCHRERSEWTYAQLAEQLGVTASQCFESMKRARASLLVSSSKRSPWSVSWLALHDVISHALRYFFPPELKASARGWPTVHSAEFVKEHFLQSENDHVVVWPDRNGPVRGESLMPLHKSVCKIIARPQEKDFYQIMCAVDLMRVGQARERSFAMDYLEKSLS